MSRLYTACMLMLLGYASVTAQRVEFQIVAVNTTPIATSEASMILGADASATDSADLDLGEREIPPIPLPGNIFYMWTTVQLPDEEIWLNPKDLRTFHVGPFLDTFELRVQWTGGKLEFRWPGIKPELIDSAYIIDAVFDFPNNVFKHKLWTSGVAETSNPSIQKYRVLVWFKGRPVSVRHDDQLSGVVISPMPFHESLRILQGAMAETVRLFDTQGRLVVHQRIIHTDAVIPTAHLAPGPYIVELTSANGTVRRQLVIRQ